VRNMQQVHAGRTPHQSNTHTHSHAFLTAAGLKALAQHAAGADDMHQTPTTTNNICYTFVQASRRCARADAAEAGAQHAAGADDMHQQTTNQKWMFCPPPCRCQGAGTTQQVLMACGTSCTRNPPQPAPQPAGADRTAAQPPEHTPAFRVPSLPQASRRWHMR
jgi:hypothetical protein